MNKRDHPTLHLNTN